MNEKYIDWNEGSMMALANDVKDIFNEGRNAERKDICAFLEQRIRHWKSEILIGGDEVVAEHYIRAYELIKAFVSERMLPKGDKNEGF